MAALVKSPNFVFLKAVQTENHMRVEVTSPRCNRDGRENMAQSVLKDLGQLSLAQIKIESVGYRGDGCGIWPKKMHKRIWWIASDLEWDGGEAGGLLTQTVIKQGNRWRGKEVPDVERKDRGFFFFFFCSLVWPICLTKRKRSNWFWAFWGQMSTITTVKENTIYYINKCTSAGI